MITKYSSRNKITALTGQRKRQENVFTKLMFKEYKIDNLGLTSKNMIFL